MAKQRSLSSLSFEKEIAKRKRRNRKFLAEAQMAIAICAQLGMTRFNVDKLFDLADEISEQLDLRSD